MALKQPKTGTTTSENETIPGDGYGDRIKAIRNHYEITQKELARRIDITPQNISEIEKNKHNPGIDLIKRIAKEFDANLDFLVFGTGPMLCGNDLPVSVDDFNEEEMKLLFYICNSKMFRYRFMSVFENLLSREEDFFGIEMERLEKLRLKD